MRPDKSYWSKAYLETDTRWDIGTVSPPLAAYIDSFQNKNANVLIPGAGNAHEAAYLHRKGYQNTHILDIVEAPIEGFRKKHPDFPKDQLHCQNFFEHNGNYDLILEQTFFCALPVAMRQAYVKKCHDLLNQNGLLVGLLFDFELTDVGPPFGGDSEGYKKLFEPYFELHVLAPCYNSIKPRLGRELFIIFEKKKP